MCRSIECGGIIVDNNMRKLLVVYQRASQKWGLPKGHMNLNELRNNDKIGCSKREILEETGLNMNSLPNTIIGKENMNNKVFFIYKLNCPIENLDLIPLDKKEIVNVMWINIDTISRFTDRNECNRSLREFNKRKMKLKKKMTNINTYQRNTLISNQFNLLTTIEV